ncbi:MAG: aldehyde dehydrogenase [Methanoculleus sp. SDB]|nr:MAG: aldehyde dehydrogenase [Methanoculleus sp. SDB]
MQMRFGGAWMSGAHNEVIGVANPATGELLDSVPLGCAEDVDAAVAAADEAWPGWTEIPPRERGRRLTAAAEKIREQADTLARLLTREQGKPLAEALNEIWGAANVFEYYASIAGTLAGTAAPIPGYGYATVVRQPLGICAAIIPWNMPALILAWKLGPALLAGNAMVVKPSQTTPLTALCLAAIVEDACGVPGVVNIVTGTGSEAGEALVAHPGIRHVSFTGQTETGRRVAARASGELKGVTLELGGSDPMIVCRDANIDAAVAGALRGRFYNCGQTCTAVKRLYVDGPVYDVFLRKLAAGAEALKVGNGMDSATTMGPMHRAGDRDRLLSLIESLREENRARVLTGGSIPPGANPAGHFLEPAILIDPDPASAVMTEEIFGPVLPVVRVDGIDEAIECANASRYGLGASVWTRDLATAAHVAGQVRCGVFWVNQHLSLPPDVPFGGVGASGIGRENGPDAPDRYRETKTILVRP